MPPFIHSLTRSAIHSLHRLQPPFPLSVESPASFSFFFRFLSSPLLCVSAWTSKFQRRSVLAKSHIYHFPRHPSCNSPSLNNPTARAQSYLAFSLLLSLSLSLSRRTANLSQSRKGHGGERFAGLPIGNSLFSENFDCNNDAERNHLNEDKAVVISILGVPPQKVLSNTFCARRVFLFFPC